MKKWNKVLSLASVIIASYAVQSCAPKKVIEEEKQPVVVAPVADLSEYYKNVFTYKTFSGKAKMRYESGSKKQNFTATFKMEKDAKVWASIVAMGIAEVARAQITPNKLQAIERLGRTSYDMSFEEGVKKLNAPISFEMLENLLVGNPIMLDLPLKVKKEEQDQVILSMEKDGFIQTLTYEKNSKKLLKQTVTSEERQFNCVIDYKDYQVISGQLFAKHRLITIDDKKNNSTTLLEMDFSNQEKDVPLDIQFSIPASYKAKSL